MKKAVMVFIVCLLAVTGCSKEKGAQSQDAKKATIKDPHVVAMVGDAKIMDKDIDAILSQIPEPYRTRYATPEAKREIVDRMAEVRMMAMEAKKRGIDKRPETQLKLEYITDQILARDLEESVLEETKISDADLTKYYNENKDKFAAGPRVKVRHILVEKENEAKAIVDQLKKGADFGKLAKEKSKCPSNQRGGELGWITKGKMDPDFERAAFALKKGELSGVVKSSFGYHIIKCDDVDAGKEKTMAEVKPLIERQMKRERRETASTQLKEEVKKKFPITINEEYFKNAQNEAEKAKTGEAAQPGMDMNQPEEGAMPGPGAPQQMPSK